MRNPLSRLFRMDRPQRIGNVEVNPDVVGAHFKGKARIEAVKRGPCTKCGGSYGYNPQIPQCQCPDGWEGTEINLGIIAESRIG